MTSKPNALPSLTWAGGQNENSEQVITNDNIPRRLALTATCFFFADYEPGRLLLCNPHPESWNKWMLPYGATPMELADRIFFDGMRQHEVEEVVRNVSGPGLQPEILERAMIEMAGVRQGTPVSRYMDVYELKISASANIWTLYYLRYYFALIADAAPPVQHRWVSLGEKGQMVKKLEKLCSEEKLTIQPNIFEALKTLESISGPLSMSRRNGEPL